MLSCGLPVVGVPEALGGSYVSIVWPLASCPASDPLWHYNQQCTIRVACPSWRVTFDPPNMLPWAWQEVKGEAVLINEADYLRWNLLAAGPRERQRGRVVGVVV